MNDERSPRSPVWVGRAKGAAASAMWLVRVKAIQMAKVPFRSHSNSKGEADGEPFNSNGAHGELQVRLATWKHLETYDPVDLHDWQDVPILLVFNTNTVDELK